MSAALLEEVTNLVEHPVAIFRQLRSRLSGFAEEVLVTCLGAPSEIFPGGRSLRPQAGAAFCGIRNGMSIHQEIVREGYERVLAARLSDARFFYNQDRRTPLSVKVDLLKRRGVPRKTGSLFDKKERGKKAPRNVGF